MQLKEYKKYRKVGMGLVSKIMNQVTPEDIASAVVLLDLSVDSTIIFDTDIDHSAFNELLIFEKVKKKKSNLEMFYETAEELPEIEEEVLEGMMDNHVSIFEIKQTNKDTGEVNMIDILNKKRKEYTLIDIGLSASVFPGQIFQMRIIPIGDKGDKYMSSGSGFPFEAKFKDKLLDNYYFQKLKKRRNLTSTELLLFSYWEWNDYGIDVRTEEI